MLSAANEGVLGTVLCCALQEERVAAASVFKSFVATAEQDHAREQAAQQPDMPRFEASAQGVGKGC